MVLQAYIDDSFDDRYFVLAGYIAAAEQWAQFSQEWEKMLEPFGILDSDGTYQFKMQEMAKTAERMSRVNGFRDIITRHTIGSVASVVDLDMLSRALAKDRGYSSTGGRL